MTYSLAVIPCTGVKDPYLEEGPAEEIWQGAHFQYTLAYVEEFFDRVLVLSYKYGLINPKQTIQTYDIDMRAAKPREHIKFWMMLKKQIDQLCEEDPPNLVGFFTGMFDRDRIIREFHRSGVKQIITPWEGKGIGYRMQAVFDMEAPFDPEKAKLGEYEVDLSSGGQSRSKYLPPPTSITSDIVWE